MKLTVIGCGYLGATHAAAMAELGHEVLGMDIDPDKVAALNAGQALFLRGNRRLRPHPHPRGCSPRRGKLGSLTPSAPACGNACGT